MGERSGAERSGMALREGEEGERNKLLTLTLNMCAMMTMRQEAAAATAVFRQQASRFVESSNTAWEKRKEQLPDQDSYTTCPPAHLRGLRATKKKKGKKKKKKNEQTNGKKRGEIRYEGERDSTDSSSTGNKEEIKGKKKVNRVRNK